MEEVKDQGYSGKADLENLAAAKNYNTYIQNKIIAFMGSERRSVDFGAGNGEMAGRLRKLGYNIAAVEADEELRQGLKQKEFQVFESISEVEKIDRIYSLNVLEHIENDKQALVEIRNKLNTGGKIFIFVPAMPELYSDFDKKLGHYRRYTKQELSEKITGAGFVIESLNYFDSGGYFAWLFMKIIGKGTGDGPSVKMIKIYDTVLFPISKILDLFFSKLFGKNLIVVARAA